MRLTALDVKKAEERRTALYARMAEFMSDYDYVMLPVTSVPPVLRRLGVPDDSRRTALGQLPRMDVALFVDNGDWIARDLGSGRVRQRRPADRVADSRTPTR